ENGIAPASLRRPLKFAVPPIARAIERRVSAVGAPGFEGRIDKRFQPAFVHRLQRAEILIDDPARIRVRTSGKHSKRQWQHGLKFEMLDGSIGRSLARSVLN